MDTLIPLPLSFELDSTEVMTNLFMPDEQHQLHNDDSDQSLPLSIAVGIHSLHNFFLRHSDGEQELIHHNYALLSSHTFFGHLPLLHNFLGEILSDMSLREYVYKSCENYYFAGTLEMTLELTVVETYVHDEQDTSLYAAVIGESFDQDQPSTSRAADESAVEELEKVLFGGDDSITTTQCAVCLEEYETVSEITRMPCNHYFHSNCIKTWLQTSHNCPLCRFSLPTSD